MTGYILCATPRSGSTLLCSLLRSSGVAGQPESWFRLQNREDWARDWGILRSDGGFDWDFYLRAAIAAGTGRNGVFGLRLMWNTLGELVTDLGGAAALDQAALLGRTLGPLRFIHLRRGDLVAQAISRHRAEASGTWHLDIEEAEHPVEACYDFARIDGYLRGAEADNAAWQVWFAANRVTPLHLAYEDLAAAPQATARRVLDLLGLRLPEGRSLHAANRRMADAISADWAARFLAEAGLAPG